MDKLFERINQFTVEMNNSNSSLHKKKVLMDYKDLKKVLEYIYDTQKVFYITSKNYIKFSKDKKKEKNKPFNSYTDLFKLLDDFSNRKITGDKALLYLYFFIQKYKKYEEIILRIIDKNLKVRAKETLINDVFPGLIKTFDVALANKYKPKLVETGSWFISRKLDGVRCLVHVDINKKTVKCFSRQGNQFKTLSKLEQSIKDNFKLFDGNYFLDGEVVSMKEGVENFKSLMEKIKRKNYTMENPSYFVFDMIKEEDFYDKKSKEILSTRLKRLQNTVSNKIKHIKLLEQIPYTHKIFNEMVAKSQHFGWEGLMLRKDVGYEGKRTNNLIKYKEMLDDEYKVIGIETGPFRYINPKTGLEIEMETMSAVVIDYKNTKVGSGFSIEERMKFYKNPELIIGKIITVQYFEKTQDSLRFPIFKGLHGEKRTM